VQRNLLDWKFYGHLSFHTTSLQHLKKELWAYNSKCSVPTAQKTKLHLNERPISPMVFSKVIILSYQIHLKQLCTLCDKNSKFLRLKQVVQIITTLPLNGITVFPGL
jgi:uncharacterized protein YjiK